MFNGREGVEDGRKRRWGKWRRSGS